MPTVTRPFCIRNTITEGERGDVILAAGYRRPRRLGRSSSVGKVLAEFALATGDDSKRLAELVSAAATSIKELAADVAAEHADVASEIVKSTARLVGAVEGHFSPVAPLRPYTEERDAALSQPARAEREHSSRCGAFAYKP